MLNSPHSTICSSSIIFANSNSIPADAFQSSISTTTSSSISTTNSSSHTRQYTSERIKFLLKQQPRDVARKKKMAGGGAIVEERSRYGFFWYSVFQRSTLKN